MKLTINQRPSGATTVHMALTPSDAHTLTPRQREDLAIGLALLDAAVRPDDSFDGANPIARAAEIMAAHEIGEAVCDR